MGFYRPPPLLFFSFAESSEAGVEECRRLRSYLLLQLQLLLTALYTNTLSQAGKSGAISLHHEQAAEQ